MIDCRLNLKIKSQLTFLKGKYFIKECTESAPLKSLLWHSRYHRQHMYMLYALKFKGQKGATNPAQYYGCKWSMNEWTTYVVGGLNKLLFLKVDHLRSRRVLGVLNF